jgi:hypothetical protein
LAIKKHISIILLFSYSLCFFAQKVNSNAGFLIKTEMTLGNQNDWFKIGLFGFGAANYKGIAIESGFSIGFTQLFKRHTLKTKGKGSYYDFFGMLGSGQNHDLLGSAVATQSNTILNSDYKNLKFKGIGFGYEKETLPNQLKKYSIKRGKFLLRYSNANTNFHLAFLNDFKAGKLFNGEGTDFGETGSFILGFTQVKRQSEIYQAGLGLTLFTPPPNYSLSPRNKKNSDHGRKNVWFTEKDVPQIFYANTFVFGTFQKDNYSFHSKLGVESNKFGALVQNKLHDGFGLNPRYPWNIENKSKIYYEFEASYFYNTNSND